jgi:hypothetical protein
MWLKNLYENVLVDIKSKNCVFVTLKACYSWERNLMTNYVLELNLHVCVHAKSCDIAEN